MKWPQSFSFFLVPDQRRHEHDSYTYPTSEAAIRHASCSQGKEIAHWYVYTQMQLLQPQPLATVRLVTCASFLSTQCFYVTIHMSDNACIAHIQPYTCLLPQELAVPVFFHPLYIPYFSRYQHNKKRMETSSQEKVFD